MVHHPIGSLTIDISNRSHEDDGAMKRRPLIGPQATALPCFKELPPKREYEDNYNFCTERAAVGRAHRIEIPWGDLTPSQVRALAKDMLEAWAIVEALTHREDLTEKQLLMRCKSAVRDGASRLPKRSGGRPQKQY